MSDQVCYVRTISDVQTGGELSRSSDVIFCSISYIV